MATLRAPRDHTRAPAQPSPAQPRARPRAMLPTSARHLCDIRPLRPLLFKTRRSPIHSNASPPLVFSSPLSVSPRRAPTPRFPPFSFPFPSLRDRRTMGSLSATLEPLRYPPARRDDSVVDDYHGVKVLDPYRWLEDPDAEEVKEFVEKQAKLTEELLQGCGERERLRREITALFDHPRYETPYHRGEKYFYFHNTGLQAQSVLYVQDGLEGQAEVLLDPNLLSEDGTVSMSLSSVSQDAEYLAYGISASGSDWVTINVMRVEDKKNEMDSLSWVGQDGAFR